MSRTITDFIISEADGLQLSVLCVVPDTVTLGIVQLVHGMCEYKERYLPFMEFLADNGYAAVIHDHRGHGKSVRNKDDLGYMYGVGADGLLQDILTVNKYAHQEFGQDLPFVLFGHSMGSLAVRAYAAMHDQSFDVLITSGTPAPNGGGAAIGKVLAKLEGRVRGRRHKSSLLAGIALGGYAKKFIDEGSTSAWISSDPQVVRAYDESEYCGFLFTDDAFLTLFELMGRAYDEKAWNCTNPDLPILVISGAEDPCMGNMRLFSQIVKSLRYIGYRDVRGKIYKDMRHEILNEREKERVYRDILHFIRSKIKKR